MSRINRRTFTPSQTVTSFIAAALVVTLAQTALFTSSPALAGTVWGRRRRRHFLGNRGQLGLRYVARL